MDRAVEKMVSESALTAEKASKLKYSVFWDTLYESYHLNQNEQNWLFSFDNTRLSEYQQKEKVMNTQVDYPNWFSYLKAIIHH